MAKSTRKARKPSRRTGLDFQESLDYLDQGISVFDGDLKLALFNRRLLDLLDLPAGLVEIGVAFEDLIRFNAERGEYGEGDVEALVRQRLELAAEPEPHCFERTRPDGTVLEVRRKPLPGGGFITTYFDVTELKRGEQALRENEDRFRRLYEMAPLGYQSLDIDGNFLEVNQAWLDMFGYAREEVIGRWFGDFIAEKDLFDTNFPRFKEAGEIHVPGYEMRCRDGSAKTIAFDGRVGYDEQGNFLQTNCILSDVTERKLAEEALRKSEIMFRLLFDTTGSITLVLAPDFQIIEFNREAERVFGVRRDDVIGKNYLELFLPEEVHEVVSEDVKKVLAGEPTIAFENPVISRDGTTHHVLWNVVQLVDPQGNSIGIITSGQDITERKRAEEALRESEERFRDVAETVSDWIWETDADLKFSYFSERYQEISGLSVERILGRTQREMFTDHIIDPEKFENHLRDLEAHRPFQDFDVQWKHPDGNIRSFHISGKPVFDGNGAFTGYRGIGTDITAKVDAERRAATAQDHLANALDSISDGFVLWDADDRLVLFNSTLLLQFPGIVDYYRVGERFEDLLKATVERGLFDFLGLTKDEWLRNRVEEHQEASGSREVVLSNGRTLLVSERKTGAGGIIGVYTDITERKLAEEELLAAKNKASEAEERLNEAARIANLGYWIWDEVNGKLIDCSEEYARIYGYTKEQMLAQTFNEQADLQFVHPDDRDSLAKTYSEFHVNPETYDVEYRAIRPDGTVRYIREIGNPIFDEQGRVVQSFGINQDITERKSMERQLAHAQKMEAIGQLTGGVAHDFNNILQVILGNLHLVSDGLGADDKAAEPIDHAISAGERGALLTQQLLSFSRRQMLNPEVVDANDVVLNIIQLLHRTLGEDTVIKTRFARDLWPVSIDPGKLEIAILNLALNARDAMPEGGELSVETSNELLKQAIPREDGDLAAGRYVVLRISDTGRGMTPEVLEQAFEPFFTTKDVGEGSGLGLSMVYGFARQSGGHLAIASEPGKRTTITMYLPVAEGRPAAKPAKTANGDGKAVAGGTVLVVEDDAEVRDITAKILKALGCKVVEAENACSALRVLENRDDIELVFTDVVMPGGMGGIGLAEEVEHLHPAIKVLLTSGYPTSDFDADDTLEDRFQLLRKPYNTLDLAAAVKAVLED